MTHTDQPIPWYPLQSGDVLHVHHSAASETPEHGETYVVEPAEDGDGQVLRLLCHTAPAAIADTTGYFEPGLVRSDPLLEIWMEVGPGRLTIVRHGRVVQAPLAEEPDPFVTPKVAAHVLWRYDATGGMEPGSFKRALLDALDRADREHTLRLAKVYPGYASAVTMARYQEDGIRVLQGIARQMLVPAAQDGGEHRG